MTLLAKTCVQCGEMKLLTEYYSSPSGRDGLMARCKECRNSYVRSYAATETGKAVRKERLAAYFKKNQDAIRLRKYGLTPEDYQRMLIEQEGLCAICHQPERATLNGQIKALSVDHDHVTGAVRRLLCLGCNSKLGWVENNLDAILDYLQIVKTP